MKALVTGGTGFVGSHIALLLNEQGHFVRVLHRETSRLSALDGFSFESAIGDVTDFQSLCEACEGCDWVFHAAAVADYWRADEARMFEVNVEGTRKVLQAARATGVKRVIFTSSAATIGIRDDGLPADETAPFNLNPEQFPYGYSKARAEAVVAEAVAEGQDVVIVNPVIVLGPGDLNMISGSFILKVKRYGRFIPYASGGISVIDVRDVARGHVAAAEKGRVGERYILMAENYSHREWLRLIAEEIGVAPGGLYMPDTVLPLFARAIELLRMFNIATPIDANQARLSARNIFFEGSKAHQALGRPRISMRQSVRDTYEWYKINGYL